MSNAIVPDGSAPSLHAGGADPEHAFGQEKESNINGLTVMHDEESAKIIAAMSAEEWAVAEKKLLRKMDVQLIPWMT